jgi:hypothetical protein
MLHSPVHSYEEFKKRVEAYHRKVEDKYTRLYLKVFNTMRDKTAYSQEDVRTLVDPYLNEWGGMWRHIPNDKKPEHSGLLDNLYDDLKRNSKLILEVKRMNIGSLTERELDDIGNLYKSLSDVRIPRERHSRLAATSAGKVLHMLAWESCIIWDNKFVRGAGKYYSDDKTGYVQYLRDKQAELRCILEGRSVGEVEAQHEKFLEGEGIENGTEPITKLLDEANYE